MTEGVGGETLVHQRNRGFETRVRQILVIGPNLIGEEHALVDDGGGGQRDGIEILRFLAAALVVDAVGENLADQEQLALEVMIGRRIAAGADENLNMVRFGASDIGCLEREELSTGTSRKPRNCCPSSPITSTMTFL